MSRFYRHIIFIALGLLFEGAHGQSISSQVESYLYSLQQQGDLTSSDLEFKISSSHQSSSSGIHHIYFNQMANGLPIVGTESSLHILNKRQFASNNRFIKNSRALLSGGIAPSVSAVEAVEAAISALGYENTSPVKELDHADGPEQKTILSDAGIFQENIISWLTYNRNSSKKIDLVWDFTLKETAYEHFWNIKVDARSGVVLSKEDLLMYCGSEYQSEAEEKLAEQRTDLPEPSVNVTPSKGKGHGCSECYEGFIWPVENPYYGDRMIVVSPEVTSASPYGWHDVDGEPGAEYTWTKGNNIEVKTVDDYAADGGEELDFTGFPLSTNFRPANRSREAATANTFLNLNMLHDVFYTYGFDEAAGNFQTNNYGNLGEENDEVKIICQNTSRCGSLFFPTSDGFKSFILFGACGNKDASLDSDVLIHEYAHGLETRLIGGAMDTDCYRNRENLLEGISDWYAKAITIAPGDRGEDATGYGNFILDQGPNGKGTNDYYYSTNMNINPLTYDDIADYRDPHDVGAVWANMLWELTWALIDAHGFDPDLHNFTGTSKDAGNIRALAIVTEAHKLMKCWPGFIDGRDAIMLANESIYNSESECYLWDAFAKRGLGIYADQGSSDDLKDGTEDFTTIPREAQLMIPDVICKDVGYLYMTGGLPFGGVYSGEGIIDNGDGRSFFIDTDALSNGTYELFYEIEALEGCYSASTASASYDIINDTEPPIPICDDTEIEQVYEVISDGYFLWDYTHAVTYIDDCNSEVDITQEPAPGSIIQLGRHILKFSFEDKAGNVSYCDRVLNARLLEGESAQFDKTHEVFIFPNPNDGQLLVENLSEDQMFSATILDVMGRQVKAYDLTQTERSTQLNIESLQTGVYFVKFSFIKAEVVKQLIKR